MFIKFNRPGKSHKYVARYISHDKKMDTALVYPDTSSRVQWSGTFNMATTDFEIAAKIMAMTASQQAELKSLAGIPNTGRKCKNPALQIIVSYNSGYHPSLSEINSDLAHFLSLAALSEHQLLWAVHNDTKNTHIHLLANRVHPETGVTVQIDEEIIKKVQAWALEKEQQHGYVQSPARLNPNKPQHRKKYISSYERDARKRVLGVDGESERAESLSREIAQKFVKLKQAEKNALSTTWEEIKALRASSTAQRKAVKIAAAAQIKQLYKKKPNPFFFTQAWWQNEEWKRLKRRARAARRIFYMQERSASGRLMNAAHLSLSAIPQKRSFFVYLTSPIARQQGLEIWLNQERDKLYNKQSIKKKERASQIRQSEHRAYWEISNEIQARIKNEQDRQHIIKTDFFNQRKALNLLSKSLWGEFGAHVPENSAPTFEN